MNCLRILSSPPQGLGGCSGGPGASFQLDEEPGCWHRTGVSKLMPFCVQEGRGRWGDEDTSL